MKKGVDYIGVAAGVMVFNAEGKVLLAKRGPKARNERGMWEFPGGSVDFNELRIDAAKREIKEEFNIDVEIISCLHTIDHMIPEEQQHWVSSTYIARWTDGDVTLMEPEKISECIWMELADIESETLSLCTQIDLVAYREKYGNTPPNIYHEM